MHVLNFTYPPEILGLEFYLTHLLEKSHRYVYPYPHLKKD